MVTNSIRKHSNTSSLKQPETCGTNSTLDPILCQKIKKHIENASSSTRHGFNIKFMHEYVQEIDILNSTITNGYDQIFKKFLDICTKLNSDKIKHKENINLPIKSSSNTTTEQSTQQLSDEQPKKKIKKTKSVKKSDTKLTSSQTTTHVSIPEFPIKQERYSVITEQPHETTTTTQFENEGDKSRASKLNKSTKAKTKKKKKKSTLSRISSSSALSITKKQTKAKSKKNKKKSSLLSANIKQELKDHLENNITKLSVASSTSSLVSTKSIPKKIALESIQAKVNSIKQEPNVITDDGSAVSSLNNIHASGKVKQMIELVEARLNATPKTTALTTPATLVRNNDIVNSTLTKPVMTTQRIVNRQLVFSQNKGNSKPSNNTPMVSNTLKASKTVSKANKLRSSIDNRKQRISSSKLEHKRNSIKQVHAFLKDLTKTNTKPAAAVSNFSTSQTPATVKKASNYIKHIDPSSALTSTQISSSSTVKAIKEEFFSFDIKNEPTEMATTMTTTVTRSVTKQLIASSSACQQNYRMTASASKNTPMIRKNSFNKFLDRNTPNKLTKYETEDKRKAELMFKEKKETERLQERDKLLQEKIEISKKKREEKIKKINEQNAKRLEEAQRKKEELDAKLKEAEENKRKIYEEKKREEYEKQKAKEQRFLQTASNNLHTTTTTTTTTTSAPTFLKSHQTPSHISKPIQSNYSNKINHTESSSSNTISNFKQPNTTNYDILTSFKSTHNTKPPTLPLQPINNIKPDLKIPLASKHETTTSTSSLSSSCVTATHCPKILSFNSQHPNDNYDINDLKSEDETDDDEEPNKPIPEWAKDMRLKRTAMAQAKKLINYTRLFRATSQNEIILEDIFKIKRKKFTERSSSAIWNSPPVWKTNGLNGNESFRLLHK